MSSPGWRAPARRRRGRSRRPGPARTACAPWPTRCVRTTRRPHWKHIRTLVDADVALRSRTLLAGGTQALLAGLRPLAQWRSPVLEVDYPVDRDLRLSGRGLLLVPSYFCWRRPTALADPSLTPVLVYPVDRTLHEGAAGGPQDLVRLLGRTRAAVLAEVAARPCRTTSEVADAVGVSLPSVSPQLGILREAGLVVSRRQGKHLLQSVTPLGRHLLSTAGSLRLEPK